MVEWTQREASQPESRARSALRARQALDSIGWLDPVRSIALLGSIDPVERDTELPAVQEKK